ncbi:MAG: hypothetical protein ACRC5M_02105 [Anaeroplasmataceae bacterium]
MKLMTMKKRYLWIMFGFLLVGSIVAVIFSGGGWGGLIVSVILFLLTTFVFQIVLSRTIKFKSKDKEKPVEKKYEFNDLDYDTILLENKFTKNEFSFGASYMKISGTKAFKVVLIYDNDAYFTPNENDSNKTPTKGLDKCKVLFGIEIFMLPNAEVLKKIKDYSFQGSKVYYQALYHDIDTSTIVEPNYLEPTQNHVESYDEIHNILQLENDLNNQEVIY